MSSRRSPSEIALELFDLIEKDGRASRWELIKVLENTAQFRHWFDGFLLKDGLLAEIQEGRDSSSTNFEYSSTLSLSILYSILINTISITFFHGTCIALHLGAVAPWEHE